MSGEVSKDTLVGLLALSEKLSLEPQLIMGALVDGEGQVPARADFAEVMPIYERLEQHLPEGVTISRLGLQIFEIPSLYHPLRALGLFLEPAHLIRVAVGSQGRFFSNMKGYVERLDARRLRVEYQLAEGTEAPECFFRFQQGTIGGLPRLLGLPDAQVELTRVWSRGAEYHVVLPRSKTVQGRVRALLSIARNGESVVETLTAQSDALRASNAALTGALEEAQEALAARERFLATISHELRTPLNGLMGSLDLAEELSPPGARPHLDSARSSTERLRTKVDVLVDYTEVV
ncbi:MAG: histidine kinase dimerization/phospho-acceptor domain-containing protein, partial [Myxococcota bacterium]